MTFSPAVPEIPAANIDKAAAYYVDGLGFTLDWGREQDGIAGISRENCRLFVTNPAFRQVLGNTGPVLLWWKLLEFIAADLDSNPTISAGTEKRRMRQAE